MTIPWHERPAEVRGLLNPAFVALVLLSGSLGYAREAEGKGMPYPLAFLLLPIVLHTETRDALPPSISTSMAAWLTVHPYLRETFPERVRSLSQTTREGVGYAIAGGALSVDPDGRLEAVAGALTSTTQSDLTRRIFSKALYVGRWFARVGSDTTVYSLWGIRP